MRIKVDRDDKMKIKINRKGAKDNITVVEMDRPVGDTVHFEWWKEGICPSCAGNSMLAITTTDHVFDETTGIQWCSCGQISKWVDGQLYPIEPIDERKYNEASMVYSMRLVESGMPRGEKLHRTQFVCPAQDAEFLVDVLNMKIPRDMMWYNGPHCREFTSWPFIVDTTKLVRTPVEIISFQSYERLMDIGL